MLSDYETHPDLPHARLFRTERLAERSFQPLNDPLWTDAYAHMRADDPVLGFCLNRQARALPWWIMKKPHVANFAVDGRPILVALCTMCSGAAAFRSEAGARRLAFRVRGRYNGTMLLEDTSTGSLWSPIAGVALAGPLRGATLERLPLAHCLWSDWLGMHPTTLVLSGERALREGPPSAPGSPGIGPGFRASLLRPLDKRLPHNTLVLGVENAPGVRAYPLATLARIGPVLNDTLGEVEIAVRSRPGTLHALAFHRRVGERILRFRCSATGEVYDEETQSQWNEMGEAVSGPFAGTQLAYVDSGVEEWYAFAARHPGTEIFAAA